MKFRCERDVLVEALARRRPGASPAAASSLPVLSGIRLELTGDQLRLTGSDLDSTILVDETGRPASRTAWPCCRPSCIGDIARSLPAGQGRGRRSRATRPASAPAGRSSRCARIPATEFPGCPSPADDAVPSPPPTSPRRCARSSSAASTDDARPILTGVLMAAEGDGPAPRRHRLVPARRPRPARHLGPARGPERARAVDGAQGARAGCSAAPTRSPCASASATRPSGRRRRLTTRLIEGEFPNYRGLIPASSPTGSPSAARRCSRRCGACACWPPTPRRCGW